MTHSTNMPYFETRTSRVFGPSTPIAADIARHLQKRQYLGTTIVICDNPLSMLSATRKQWLKIGRTVLKQRASTLNAEEILRYTHCIMHMQHLQFVAEAPNNRANAEIYFITPQQLLEIPPNCSSIYITSPPTAEQLKYWISAMPTESLIVDYLGDLALDKLGLNPKSKLEKQAYKEWAELKKFMNDHNLDTSNLISGAYIQNVAIDEALDKILNASQEFLRRAAHFQHALCLAQPLTHSSHVQSKEFEAMMRLAYRVQMLTPGIFSNYLSDVFEKSAASSFFLRESKVDLDVILKRPSLAFTYTDPAQ